jgi:hypothetical protein
MVRVDKGGVTMKVIPEHVKAMESLIAPFDTEERREVYRNGQFPRADLVKDVNHRYRWDLFYMAKAYRGMGDAEYDNTHIDTALRSIVPKL